MELLKKATKEKKISNAEFFRIVSKKLNCSLGPVNDICYCKKEWIPIPIINLTLSMIQDNESYRNRIIKSVEFLKCNNATSKQIRAIKSLTIDLCKIAGAHAGDGNLHVKLGIQFKDLKIIKKIKNIFKECECAFKMYKTRGLIRCNLRIERLEVVRLLKPFFIDDKIIFWISYGINIADHYKAALEAYQNWIFNTFGIRPKLSRYSTKDAYRVDLDNKIIGRYLNKFLDFPMGEKTYTVKEPKIISTSSLRFRKAFVCGYMTFDGCVHREGNRIEVSSKSYDIIRNTYQILSKAHIPMKDIRQDTYGRWICLSKGLNRSKLNKAIFVFEKGTEKSDRLYNKIENARS
ncbi:hypothetical protein HYT58_00550 [Candidatus Woesearchaeota archaeon]|nr:hypothetical protein [Candidatus Woesearchaeota archaeon]